MEVHAHTHTERKRFKHYLWEFLMLFLAVFCGFLAENIRERSVEKHREKQFIQSLYNDVKADTANLSRIIASRTVKDQIIDSLFSEMKGRISEKATTQIYSLAIPISRTLSYRFVANDGTMQQLKNSGAFRLIRKHEVVDSIARYDVNVRNMAGQWGVEENLIDHYRTAAAKIFDALIFDKMIDENMNTVRLPAGNPPLQPFTPRELYEWNYRLYSVKAINRANRREARLLLQQAINLLKTLEKKYHLK